MVIFHSYVSLPKGKYTINSKLLVITRGVSPRIFCDFPPRIATSPATTPRSPTQWSDEISRKTTLVTSCPCQRVENVGFKMCGKLMVYHISHTYNMHIYIYIYVYIYIYMGILPFTSLYERITSPYERVWIAIIYLLLLVLLLLSLLLLIIIVIIITELGQSNSDSSMIAGQTHLCQSFPRTPFFLRPRPLAPLGSQYSHLETIDAMGMLGCERIWNMENQWKIMQHLPCFIGFSHLYLNW